PPHLHGTQPHTYGQTRTPGRGRGHGGGTGALVTSTVLVNPRGRVPVGRRCRLFGRRRSNPPQNLSGERDRAGEATLESRHGEDAGLTEGESRMAQRSRRSANLSGEDDRAGRRTVRAPSRCPSSASTCREVAVDDSSTVPVSPYTAARAPRGRAVRRPS